jgi:hypothetical protein
MGAITMAMLKPKLILCFTILISFIFGVAYSNVKSGLRDRCLAAIESTDLQVKRNQLKDTVIDIPGGKYMFEFKNAAGDSFFCDICDDTNPAVQCGMIGLRLVHRPKDGEAKDMPAELDKKCAYFLQKELSKNKSAMEVNHELVKRIVTTPSHTDTRWVYRMELDGEPFQCVIRKSDGSFRVERKQGDEWLPMAAGVLF